MHAAIRRRLLPFAALLAGFALFNPDAAADKEEGFTPLCNGKDFTGFKFFLDKNADPMKTWSLDKGGVIFCNGKPNGYFYTEKSYKNYTLRYDWKYDRPADLMDDAKFKGNSGCLIHIQEPHKIWPKSVEVQGMNREHGKIFAIFGAKGEFKFDPDMLQKVRHKVGEWNTTEIICKDGHITSKVNGAEISSGTSTDVKEGPIGWQSEGVPISFRNIRIKEMK